MQCAHHQQQTSLSPASHNLAKAVSPLKDHVLWVSDITYITLKKRFACLFLITDAGNRKIVGHHASDDMKISSGVVALKKAMDPKPVEKIVINYSNRGIQKYSHEYVNFLLQYLALISMTQAKTNLKM